MAQFISLVELEEEPQVCSTVGVCSALCLGFFSNSSGEEIPQPRISEASNLNFAHNPTSVLVEV
jgi:hypothetical protein